MRAILLAALVAPAALAESAISLHAGGYRLIDRADSAYDGRELALRLRLPLHASLTFVSELGAGGEFAGDRGTCLGELSARAGAATSLAPGPAWLRLNAALGAGLVFARLYGSRFGAPEDGRLASGDRFLPQLWGSMGLTADVLGPLSVSLEASARWTPSARFHADHVPEAGAFYPALQTAHQISTWAAAAGLAWRL